MAESLRSEALLTSPPVTRLYQGPKQEKHYRKQRQLLQREQEVLAMPDEHKQLVPIENPVLDIPRIVVLSNNKGQTDWSIILYAYAVYFVAMSINASVAYKLGTTAVDKVEMAVLGAMFETGLFLLLIPLDVAHDSGMISPTVPI
jgi:hypothetical protein